MADIKNDRVEGASCSDGQKAKAVSEINPLMALANRIDEADHMILRVVNQDDVGNSELKDDHVSGTDHNLIVDALRKQAAVG